MNSYLVLFGRNVTQELPKIVGYMEAEVDRGTLSDLMWGDFGDERFESLNPHLDLAADSKVVVAKVTSDSGEHFLPFLRQHIQDRFEVGVIAYRSRP